MYFFDSHWSGYLGPANGYVNGSQFFLNKPTPYCFAIEAARDLAATLGLSASFVVSDVYDAVAAFGAQRFDIVYTGIGALCWLPDLPRWARLAAELLRPGGFVYLVEGHPFAAVLDDEHGSVISQDYFDTAPWRESYPFTYTDGDAELAHPARVEFPHTLGEILTALAQAGLRLEQRAFPDHLPGFSATVFCALSAVRLGIAAFGRADP